MAARFGIRSVDLGDDGLQNWRSRGHLHHRDSGPEILRDGGQQFARRTGDRVTAVLAFALIEQHDLDVALPGLAAQIVVAHQSIEVERRSGANVGLQGGDLRQLTKGVGETSGDIGGDRKRRPLRQVDHHVEFRLVVEGQHLHRHRLGVEHRAGEQEGHDDAGQQHPSERSTADERRDNRPVDVADDLLGALFARLGAFQRFQTRAKLVGAPRGENEGGEQGEAHSDRAEHGDGPHVGSHHAADKPHRQKSGKHGQRGDDGWITNLAHGVHRHLDAGASVQQPASEDVLGHHGGVIDEDADGEHQGEQAHPIDGVVERPGRPDGDQDHEWDDDDDHRSRTPPDRNPGDDADGESSLEQGGQQLVDLVVGGLAVVAGYADLNIFRDQGPLQAFKPREDRVGYGNTVGPLFLGDGDGHSGGHVRGRHAFRSCGPPMVGDQLADLLGPLEHPGDVVDIDGHAVLAADHESGNVLGGMQIPPGAHPEQPVARLQGTCATLQVGLAHSLSDIFEAHPVTGQTLWVHLDSDLRALAADDEPGTGVRHLLQTLEDIVGKVAQVTVVEHRRPEGRRDHRHVVYALRLHQRHRNPWRDLVEVTLQLVVDLDDGGTEWLSDLEAHDDHPALALGGGVDVLDAIDLAHHRLQRADGEVLDLLGGGARIVEKDIDHGHGDLRVFLPRRHEQPDDADDEGCHHQQRREG